MHSIIPTDITEFKTLKDLYSFIDLNAFQLELTHSLADLVREYRAKSDDKLEKQKGQWDLECLLHDLKSSRPFYFSTSDGMNPVMVEKEPKFDTYQQSAFEYIKHRASTTRCQLLVARYNHVLWKGPKGVKNRKFGLIAIPAYQRSVEEYNRRYTDDRNLDNALHLCQLFECLASLCQEVKFGIPELKECARYCLSETDLPFFAKHAILRDMLDYPKLFKTEDFSDALAVYEHELARVNKTKSEDGQLAKYYLPTALKVAKKIKLDILRWENEIGLAYLRWAEAETDVNRFLVKQMNYASAIDAFAKSGNDLLKKETEQKYTELKPFVKLSNVPISFPQNIIDAMQQNIERIHSYAENILQGNSADIYRLIGSVLFFEGFQAKFDTSYVGKNSMLDNFTIIQFDRNRNITKSSNGALNFGSPEQSYANRIQESILPFLRYIFIQGAVSGKLTSENFLSFLKSDSWIGIPYLYTDLVGEGKAENWMHLLIPAIDHFFIQLNSPAEQPTYILCTDSLTIKIEGLFRNLAQRMNIGTSVGRSKGMQEAYIHNILDNDTFKQYLNEDDILFFRYLFANEGGLNLRNNVAHSFYQPQDYTVEKMLLLLAALLKVAKYKLAAS